jgi:hypothetical protein
MEEDIIKTIIISNSYGIFLEVSPVLPLGVVFAALGF